MTMSWCVFYHVAKQIHTNLLDASIGPHHLQMGIWCNMNPYLMLLGINILPLQLHGLLQQFLEIKLLLRNDIAFRLDFS